MEREGDRWEGSISKLSLSFCFFWGWMFTASANLLCRVISFGLFGCGRFNVCWLWKKSMICFSLNVHHFLTLCANQEQSFNHIHLHRHSGRSEWSSGVYTDDINSRQLQECTFQIKCLCSLKPKVRENDNQKERRLHSSVGVNDLRVKWKKK